MQPGGVSALQHESGLSGASERVRSSGRTESSQRELPAAAPHGGRQAGEPVLPTAGAQAPDVLPARHRQSQKLGPRNPHLFPLKPSLRPVHYYVAVQDVVFNFFYTVLFVP